MTEGPTHELELTEAELDRLMLGRPRFQTDSDMVRVWKLVATAHQRAQQSGSARLELDSGEWRDLTVAFQPHYNVADEELLNKITAVPGVRVPNP